MMCNGTRFIYCPTCQGSSRVKCRSCEGRGTFLNDPDSPACTSCGKSEFLSCLHTKVCYDEKFVLYGKVSI